MSDRDGPETPDVTPGSEPEDLYRTLFEENHAVMLLIDPSTGEIVDGNPAACRYYGYTRDTLRSLRISEINTLSPEEIRQEMRRALRAQRRHFYFRHRLASGEVRDVEVYSGPVRLRGRQLLYSLVHDVTARRRIERDLRDSEARYRALFDQVPTCIAVFTAARDGEDFVLLDINQAACNVEDLQPEQAIGRSVLRVLPGAVDSGLFDALQRVWGSGEPEEVPLTYYSDSERSGWRRGYLYKLPSGEVVFVYEDATAELEAQEARARLEEHVRRSQRLESIGALAGGIAHDFSSLLSSIIGFTEITLRELDPGTEAAENLGRALSAARRARDLVAQILTFSRQADTSPQPLLLSKVTEEVLTLVRPSLPDSIQVRLLVAPDLPLVLADPTQMHQVVLNLVTNAAQAIGTSPGVIEIRIGPRELDEPTAMALGSLSAGQYVALEVIDTGPGIPRELRERIFDPFFTTKAPGEGTGLGLSTVHGIASAHHGAVVVESEPGEGAVFTLYLPSFSSSTEDKDRALSL